MEVLKVSNDLDSAFDEVYREAIALPKSQRHWISLFMVHGMKRTRLIPLVPGQTIELLPEIFARKPLEDAQNEIFHQDGLRLKRELP